MLAADRASWQNPRILVLLLLVFLSGALAGALAMRTSVHKRLHAATSYWKDDSSQLFSYNKLTKELNLTPEQSDRLKMILDDFAKYHEDLEAQIEDMRATGKNRIVQMLTPEQRKKFDELAKQLSAN